MNIEACKTLGVIPEGEAVRSAILAEILQHFADGAMRLKRMPQCFIQSDFVAVSTANFRDLQETGFDQLGHDLLHHSLRDSHHHRGFSRHCCSLWFRVSGDIHRSSAVCGFDGFAG